MKFSASILEVNAFKEMMRALSVVNKEAVISFTENGLESEIMNDENTVMVKWSLNDRGFLADYEYEEGTKLNFDMETLMKFIEGFGKDDDLKLILDAEENTIKVEGKTHSDKGGGRRKSFSVKLLDLEDKETPHPKIFFKSQAKIISESLSRAVKDASLVSEFVSFNIDESKLEIGALGDLGSAVNTWEKGADELVSLRLEEPSKSKFAIDKVAPILAQIARINEVVTIELSTDMPIRFEVEPLHGKVEYYIAPVMA